MVLEEISFKGKAYGQQAMHHEHRPITKAHL